MGALRRRGSINLFTCAVFHKGETKSVIYLTNCKGKDKFAIGVFLRDIYLKQLVLDSDIQKSFGQMDHLRNLRINSSGN